MFAKTLRRCEQYGDNAPSIPTDNHRVASISTIKKNLRSSLIPTLAHWNDFAVDEWQALSNTKLDVLLTGPDFCCATVYAVDCRDHWVYFTLHRPQDSAAVYAAPFLYLAQAEHAIKLLRVPSERLRDYDTEESTQIAFILGIPRSGTTLLSKIIEAAGAYVTSTSNGNRRIISLSEPDVFGELCALRTFTGSNDTMIVDYLCVLLPFICRGPDTTAVKLLDGKTTTRSTTFVIKPRSQANRLIDLIQNAHKRLFPRSSNVSFPSLVSMRDCVSVCKSMATLCDGEDVNSEFGISLQGNLEALSRQMPILRKLRKTEQDSLSGVEVLVCLWCSDFSSCYDYIMAHPASHNVLPVYYSELTSSPQDLIPTILHHLRCVPDLQNTNPGLIKACVAAMTKDSQAGTIMSGKDKILLWNDKHDREVRDILEELELSEMATPEYRFQLLVNVGVRQSIPPL